MIALIRSLFALLLVCAVAPAPRPVVAGGDPWDPYRFLIGDWKGEGGGRPGQGFGEFSFKLDLQEHVLMRRASAELSNSKHEDLMVVYREPGTSADRAMYFDNEGHVIRYGITAGKDGKSLLFTSDPQPGTTRYRLTYTQTGSDSVGILFETASPAKPDAFVKYIDGSAKRVEAAAAPKDGAGK
jgi:hypothetical protein